MPPERLPAAVSRAGLDPHEFLCGRDVGTGELPTGTSHALGLVDRLNSILHGIRRGRLALLFHSAWGPQCSQVHRQSSAAMLPPRSEAEHEQAQ
eukprot:scaffold779_cov355-Prasinococcus_capsulatus_cf.AAC.6